MTPLQEDWQVLMDLFPTNWRELAKTGSIVRLRHFKSVEDVLRTLLLHVGRGWGCAKPQSTPRWQELPKFPT